MALGDCVTKRYRLCDHIEPLKSRAEAGSDGNYVVSVSHNLHDVDSCGIIKAYRDALLYKVL